MSNAEYIEDGFTREELADFAERKVLLRRNAKLDTIYVLDNGAGVTPDGVGFFWYDSLEEAREAHGDDTKVIHGYKDVADF